MRIHELRLINFRGVRDFTLKLDGRDAKVYGDNKVGKSTLKNGFIWLFAGTDDLGRADYQIKTLDAGGNAIPMLDHTARGVVEHDGAMIELTRTYREVWTKRAGSNEKTFTGHETEYLINNVPKAAKDYKAFVDKIVPVQLLKLLIMPGYFCEQLKAEDRRKMLLEVCGDVDEQELLRNPRFQDLALHVSKFVTVADLKSQKTAEKKKLNDDMKSIPVAVNIHTQYLNAGGLNEIIEQQAVDLVAHEIARLEAERTGLTNGVGVAQLRKDLAELQTAKAKAETEAIAKVAALKAPIRKTLEAAESESAQISSDLSKDNATRDTLERIVKRLKDEKQLLLAGYREISASEFSGDTICPVCGQDIPEDKLEAARGAFNENRAGKLDANVKAGKSLAADIAAKEQELVKVIAHIDQLEDDSTLSGAIIRSLEKELEDLKPVVVFDDSAIAAKQAEIDSFGDSVSGRKGEINLEISRLTAKKAVHEQNLAAIRQAEKAEMDIAELKAKEKDLAAKYETCERLIALCDDFTSAKVAQLDTKISGAFRIVAWKLTETQVNGGLKEICDALIDGVPYGAANHAAQVNAGLDVIRSFSRAYGVTMPIFIDNAESVVSLNPMDGMLDKPQIIRLIVSENHPELTLELC
jgi:hypothetical protein